MRKALGVDLGGTNIAVGLVAEDGRLLAKDSVPTRHALGPETVIEDMAALCKDVLAQTGTAERDIDYIGIGVPGSYDNVNGVVVFCNNIRFFGVPIRRMLGKHFDVPVILENDANAAALGESIAGATKGRRDSITVTLGTGVGGGIIVGNKILSGYFGNGGEVGHQVVAFDGEPCTCGRKGCWEAYASMWALIRDAGRVCADNPNTAILTKAGGDAANITGKLIFDAADEGDANAQALVNRYYRYVACGLANLINIFQTEVIAVGGGVSARGGALLEPVKQEVKQNVYAGNFKTEIVIAALGNDAGIIGAGMVGRQ